MIAHYFCPKCDLSFEYHRRPRKSSHREYVCPNCKQAMVWDEAEVLVVESERYDKTLTTGPLACIHDRERRKRDGGLVPNTR